MAADGLLLKAALNEVVAIAQGAIVQRVHMPRPDAVSITFRAADRGTVRLYICCHPVYGRVHLTARRPSNPPTPPPFCMLLRKHLEGKRLAAAGQRGLDRVIFLRFVNERHPVALAELWVELIGSRSNVVLTDGGGRLLGALRSLPAGRVATLGDGPVRYESPPPSGKLELSGCTGTTLQQRLADTPGDRPVWRALLSAVEGPGPDTCRELAWRAGVDPDAKWGVTDGLQRLRLVEQVLALRNAVHAGRLEPSALLDAHGSPIAYAALSLHATAAVLANVSLQTFPSVQALCDDVLFAQEAAGALADLRSRLLAEVRRHLERSERKLAARQEDLERGEAAADHRRYGELILAQLHRVPRGAEVVELPNLYDPDQGPVQIPLDPGLSPIENAQRYFERARRLERTRQQAERFRREAEGEVAYLRHAVRAIEQAADLPTLWALVSELRAQGYPVAADLRPMRQLPAATEDRPANHAANPAAGAKETGSAGLSRYVSRDGWILIVGKNSRENDRITFQVAKPSDWWFHVKGEAGAHVIARPPDGVAADQIPPATVEDAALLAAYYSRARQGQNVPVDYTQRHHVRRLRGAAPGLVYYEGHRTVYVTPDPARITQLRGR